MTQLIISMIVGVVYSALAYIYLNKRYKEKKIIAISMVIPMLIIIAVINYLHAFHGSSDCIEAFEYMTMTAICFPAAWVDAKEKLIPNTIILAGLVCRIVLYIVRFFISAGVLLEVAKNDLLALAVITVFCLLGRLLVKNGIGMGDIKLLLVLAILGGFDRMFSMLFCAMLVSFFWGLFELIVRKKGKNATIPFGPPIAIGTVLSVIMYALV